MAAGFTNRQIAGELFYQHGNCQNPRPTTSAASSELATETEAAARARELGLV